MQCLKAAGAGNIIVVEISETRKKKALEIGADAVIDPTEEEVSARVREMTAGEGSEHSFDAAGIQETLQTALHATRKGGTVTIVSIWEGPAQVNPNDIVLSELNVAERIPLSDVVEGGFEELVDHKDRRVKILVRAPG